MRINSLRPLYSLLKKPRVLVFDEAVANLDKESADLIAQTVNQLRGRASIVFITHQVPESLLVDAYISFGANGLSKNENPSRRL